MKTLNEKSSQLFKKIIDLMKKNDNPDYLKINNSSVYLPLVIEKIGGYNGEKNVLKGCELISFAHYGEQNGDAMRDPEMCFLYKEENNIPVVTPYYFRNDYVGLELWSIEGVEDENDFKVKSAQKTHASFADEWFKNIEHQQDL